MQAFFYLKRLFQCSILISGLLGQSGLAQAAPSSQASVTVTIPQGATGKGPAAYGVNPLMIKAGTTVTWVNQDSVPHTATSDTGFFDSGALNSGQSFSFQFKNPGKFPYFCTIHGKTSMSGAIEVR